MCGGRYWCCLLLSFGPHFSGLCSALTPQGHTGITWRKHRRYSYDLLGLSSIQVYSSRHPAITYPDHLPGFPIRAQKVLLGCMAYYWTERPTLSVGVTQGNTNMSFAVSSSKIICQFSGQPLPRYQDNPFPDNYIPGAGIGSTQVSPAARARLLTFTLVQKAWQLPQVVLCSTPHKLLSQFQDLRVGTFTSSKYFQQDLPQDNSHTPDPQQKREESWVHREHPQILESMKLTRWFLEQPHCDLFASAESEWRRCCDCKEGCRYFKKEMQPL